MSPLCQIQLLGGLRVQMGDRVIMRFSTQKTAALLAYLAYYPHQEHPREVLIERLWPDAEILAGRNRLRQALSSLRRQLEPPGVPDGSLLAATYASIRLNAQAIQTDVAAFETALSAAAKAHPAAEQAYWLQEAVDRYSGELLPGFYEAWVLSEQHRLAKLYFQAVHWLTELLEQKGDFDPALRYAQRALSLDPLQEDLHARIMHLHLAAGTPALALEQFRELERLLAEQMGTRPSAALQHLAQEIERGAVRPALEPIPIKPLLPAPSPRQQGLPAGTITFLLIAIQDSAALLERAGDSFKQTLDRHCELLRKVFERYGGYEIQEAGDFWLVAFERASDALACALAGQTVLTEEPWPAESARFEVRMAMHTGEVEPDSVPYAERVLDRASRIRNAGHGGQILCSQTTAELLRGNLPPEARLADLGVYRLRDGTEPERLFQVAYPGLSQREFPPLKAETGYPSHLPPQMTRFFGREPEITRLKEMIWDEKARLVVITGPGGTGKTRLSLEVAARLIELFAGAVWFAPLADLSDAGLISGAIVEAMRLPQSGSMDPFEQAVDALSKHPSLLVLDNFEHLIEHGAPVVQTLLERAPQLTCLITSRQSLNLSGEREFALNPLSTPNGPDTPERLTLYESVRLFIDRAQAVRPDFQVTNRNAPAVAAICDRLEGIPLAIELAAARAQILSPGQILAQLQHRFEFLVSKRRDITARHRTLRAAIDWSYRLLSPDLQRFFARLSVFRGGWTLEAAEVVCEEPQALDCLEHLKQCSLVVGKENEADMRFLMLETIREYAEEHLAAEEALLLRQRHQEFFRKLTEEADTHISEPDSGDWCDRLERDHANLQAVLERCKAGEGDRITLQRIVADLWGMWELRGHYAVGRKWLEEALSYPEEEGQEVLRVMLLNGAGAIASYQGDPDAGRSYLEQGLAIVRRLGDKQGLHSSLYNLGVLAHMQGDNGKARAFLEESLALCRELENKNNLIAPLAVLGGVLNALGDHVPARIAAEESLALSRTTGNRMGVAIAFLTLAGIALEQGEFNVAGAHYREALTIYYKLGHKLHMAFRLEELAEVARIQGQADRAVRLLGMATALRDAHGEPLGTEEQLEFHRKEADLRSLLDAETFTISWETGRAATVEQAISYALEDTD